MFARPIHAGLKRLAGTLAIFVVSLSGCAKKTRAPVPAAPAPASARIGSTETGIASWYGKPYHGRQAASGEIYDMEKLTAAHRTLPFNTWVEVTDLDNGKCVSVRINDRGPFVDHRIIDLSLAAARSIDMVGSGTARVQLRVIEAPRTSAAIAAQPATAPTPAAPAIDPPAITPIPPSPAPLQPTPLEPAPSKPSQPIYAVQAAAFSDAGRARAFAASLHNQYKDAGVIQSTASGHTVWRVLVARNLSIDDANRLASQVREALGEAVVLSNP